MSLYIVHRKYTQRRTWMDQPLMGQERGAAGRDAYWGKGQEGGTTAAISEGKAKGRRRGAPRPPTFGRASPRNRQAVRRRDASRGRTAEREGGRRTQAPPPPPPSLTSLTPELHKRRGGEALGGGRFVERTPTNEEAITLSKGLYVISLSPPRTTGDRDELLLLPLNGEGGARGGAPPRCELGSTHHREGELGGRRRTPRRIHDCVSECAENFERGGGRGGDNGGVYLNFPSVSRR